MVRLLSYGRSQRPHTSRKKIPYLMLLAPDRLVLYTAADDGQEEMMVNREGSQGNVMDIARIGLDERGDVKQTRGSRKLISLTASVGSSPQGANVTTSCMVSSGSSKITSLDSEDDGEEEELLDGQEFRLGISMNQIIDIQITKQRDMIVVYHPNKPSKRWITEEETSSSYTTSFVRSLVTKMSFGASSDRFEYRDILSKYPHAHFFLIRFQNSAPEEVIGFRDSVYHAAQRFNACMAWMSKQLPLKEESKIIMVTCGHRHSREGYFCHPFPELGEPVMLPREVGKAMVQTESDVFMNTVITMYIETPLGTSRAEISLMELENSFLEGSAPIEVVGKLQQSPEAPEGYCWHVSIHFKAERSKKAVGKVRGTNSTEAHANETIQQKDKRNSVLRKHSMGLGAPIVFSLAALKTGASVARHLRPKGHNEKQRKTVHRVFDWCVTIVSVDIALDPNEGVHGAVPRMMSTSAISDSVSIRGKDLAPPFHHLMGKYPNIIRYDTAKRFIVGLDSESKAYQGLVKMVDFWMKHKLEHALTCPQPAFKSMKRNYPHGLIGWSSKSDCLIEFEAMGKWPEAYKTIIGEGFSEDDILQHLVFCYLFTFDKIDNRPWPKGKTVKIMDIEGLQMSHLGQPGFKFITKIANVLAIMFPQRMHQCIFVNVPSWWSMAWRVMSPMIPEKVRSQMQMFGKNSGSKAKEALLEWIEEDILPTKYGGKNDLPNFLDSSYEKTLVEYATSLSP